MAMLPVIAAVATAGSALYTAARAGSQKMPGIEMPKAPKAEEVINNEASQANAIATQRRRAVARGGQTRFSSPLGVSQQAQTARQTLLGA